MPYHLPVFNLTGNLWRAAGGGPPVPLGLPTMTFPCQLRLYKTAFVLGTNGYGTVNLTLCVPKLTDIRAGSRFFPGPSDVVEVPAGSGRYYTVQAVDDVAKGFVNEYRLALINQRTATTIPLP